MEENRVSWKTDEEFTNFVPKQHCRSPITDVGKVYMHLCLVLDCWRSKVIGNSVHYDENHCGTRSGRPTEILRVNDWVRNHVRKQCVKIQYFRSKNVQH